MEEEFSIPLSDECTHADESPVMNADDETVSSAPPRLEIDVDTVDKSGDSESGRSTEAAAVDDAKEEVGTASRQEPQQLLDTKVEPSRSPLTTPTNASESSANHMSASSRKFVHFLSDAEGTPITTAHKQFVDGAALVGKIRQPSIDEGNDEDEKKEDTTPVKDLKGQEQVSSAPLEPDVAVLTPVPTQPQEAVVSTPSSSSNNLSTVPSPVRSSIISPPGRRSITLRLLEEVDNDSSNSSTTTSLTPFKRLNLRRFRSLSLSTVMVPLNENKIDMTDRSNNNVNNSNSSGSNNNNSGSETNETTSIIDRGIISVSWYEGTTSAEMQEHVFNCVLRKLKTGSGSSSRIGGGKKMLEDVRLLDESVVPHEEVVLCPFLPDGSHFLLKFKTTTPTPPKPRDYRIPPYISQAPDSPSAEPSPFPSSGNLNGLGNTNAVNAQLQLLNAATALLQSNGIKTQGVLGRNGFSFGGLEPQKRNIYQEQHQVSVLPKLPALPNVETVPREFKEVQPKEEKMQSPNSVENDTANNSTDALIEQQLRQLNELFLLRNGQASNITTTETQPPTESQQSEQEDPHLMSYYKSQEKKQVIFTIANYFVLFMSLIAISAEIQGRLPQWMAWVQDNYDSVQNCATDNDALFECISNGNFSGLVASFMLWATQSASAKRIFLFGFDTPKKLWTVVYEALVSAVCWGLSYIFIRRGLNPNTREKFIQKYWKDAVYGSLAGFNAAFLKAVLKNLVPQDVALQAIENRQVRLFHWLGMLMSEE